MRRKRKSRSRVGLSVSFGLVLKFSLEVVTLGGDLNGRGGRCSVAASWRLSLACSLVLLSFLCGDCCVLREPI